MRYLSRRTLVLATTILVFFAGQTSAENLPVQTFTVSQTYNNAPFDYQSRQLSDRAQFRVYRLTYPSPVVTSSKANNTVPADYYVPKNLVAGAKYPAAICLHILDGDEQLMELVCSVLASRGVPAISFKLPYYGERSPGKGPEVMVEDPRTLVGALGQTLEDIRRTVDLLASREEINPDRIGVTGISLGGITGATASALEPRIYRAALMLAGGDLYPIIRDARETRQIREMLMRLPQEERRKVETSLAAVDPLVFAPKLRDRAMQGRVLMINAGNDEVIPRPCTEKLAEALGISNRVVWLEGLGHYTAMVELPRALRMMADFFAQDLPPEAKTAAAQQTAPASKVVTPNQRLVAVVEQLVTMLTVVPEAGRCHFVDLEATFQVGQSKEVQTKLRLARGHADLFSLSCNVPVFGELAAGQCDYPWLLGAGKSLIAGTINPLPGSSLANFVDQRHVMRLRLVSGLGGGIVMAPEMLQQWIVIEDGNKTEKNPTSVASTKPSLRITAKEQRKVPGAIQIAFAEDGRTPTAVDFSVLGVHGHVAVRGWQTNAVAPKEIFDPPQSAKRTEVDQTDLNRIMASLVNVLGDRLDIPRPSKPSKPDEMSVLARDPAGHGLLCRNHGKLILMVTGTPEEMGAAQGTLLAPMARRMAERAVYLVGGADTLRSGVWFFDTMADIERRTTPHVPPRFFAECDALAKAAGVSQRDGRYANLFPERFHCSGVAVRGKASVGGRVLHARILDYMRDIDLQDAAVLTLYMPNDRNRWISQSYAGLIGTVTCMNEKGLAIGEMGGRGEGQWDGLPMTFLLRDIMERAATVEEAVAMFQKTPRTCVYYYVVSDRSGDMVGLACTPEKVEVLRPGQQDARLAFIPEDTVLISAGERIKLLSQRVQENYGKIDVPKLQEIIKRPVAMESNLHDAIFAPETLEMWFADAGKETAACDEPYAHIKLDDLIRFYAEHIRPLATARLK